MLPPGRHLPGDSLMYGFYNRFGESVPFIGLARAAARLMRNRSAEATRRAGKRAVEALVDLVQPWALEVLAAHRAEGRPLVLATTSPVDLVDPAGRRPRLRRGHRHPVRRAGRPLHRQAGRRVRVGPGQAGRGRSGGPADHDVDLGDSHAYSDSFFDLPLFLAVGHPHPVNADPRLAAVALARRWPLEYWDRAPGIPSVVGLEPYHLVRPFFRPEAFPYARFDLERDGAHPAVRPGAAGLQPPELLRRGRHRHGGRPPGPAGAVHGQAGGVRRARWWASWPGPSAASRSSGASGSSDPMRRAAAALRAGEVVIVLPQGTIPRGEAFFDPVLIGPHRHRPAGRRDRCAGHPHRAVGDRAGVAPVVEGAQRHRPAAPAPGHHQRRPRRSRWASRTRWPTPPR